MFLLAFVLGLTISCKPKTEQPTENVETYDAVSLGVSIPMSPCSNVCFPCCHKTRWWKSMVNHRPQNPRMDVVLKMSKSITDVYPCDKWRNW